MLDRPLEVGDVVILRDGGWDVVEDKHLFFDIVYLRGGSLVGSVSGMQTCKPDPADVVAILGKIAE